MQRKRGWWSKLKKCTNQLFTKSSKPHPIYSNSQIKAYEDELSDAYEDKLSETYEDELIEAIQIPSQKEPVVVDEKEARKLLFRRDQSAMSSGAYPFHSRFSTDYKLRCLLGQGSFGFVFLAEHKTSGKLVAVKFILRDRVTDWRSDPQYGLVPKEVHILACPLLLACQTCKVIKLLDYMSDATYCYMICEHWGVAWSSASSTNTLSGKRLIGWKGGWRLEQSPGDLFECIEAHSFLPVSTIHHIFVQLLNTVVHLYDKHGIVHRDLKDENVVVDADYVIRLIDFGSAVNVHNQDDLTKNFHGTLAFAAPEVIRCSNGGGTHMAPYEPLPAEAWSLGILLYTMAMRKAPFSDPWSIMHADPTMPLDDPSGAPGIIV